MYAIMNMKSNIVSPQVTRTDAVADSTNELKARPGEVHVLSI